MSAALFLACKRLKAISVVRAALNDCYLYSDNSLEPETVTLPFKKRILRVWDLGVFPFHPQIIFRSIGSCLLTLESFLEASSPVFWSSNDFQEGSVLPFDPQITFRSLGSCLETFKSFLETLRPAFWLSNHFKRPRNLPSGLQTIFKSLELCFLTLKWFKGGFGLASWPSNNF